MLELKSENMIQLRKQVKANRHNCCTNTHPVGINKHKSILINGKLWKFITLAREWYSVGLLKGFATVIYHPKFRTHSQKKTIIDLFKWSVCILYAAGCVIYWLSKKYIELVIDGIFSSICTQTYLTNGRGRKYYHYY